MEVSPHDAKIAGHAIGTLLAVTDEIRALWPLEHYGRRDELEALGKRLIAEALAEEDGPESEWDTPPVLRAVPSLRRRDPRGE